MKKPDAMKPDAKKHDASRRSRATSVLLAAGVLVGAANIGAYAATGHPLVLGHTNKAGHTTTLVNTGKGATLALHGKKSHPPLSVSSKKKVKHLNADLLDGRNAASLANTAITYGLPSSGSGTSVTYSFPGLPANAYLIAYSVSRQAAASGKALPRMACSMHATSTTIGQLRDYSAAGRNVTANASGVLRVDPTATLVCNVAGGHLVAGPSATSTISFLKVERTYNNGNAS